MINPNKRIQMAAIPNRGTLRLCTDPAILDDICISLKYLEQEVKLNARSGSRSYLFLLNAVQNLKKWRGIYLFPEPGKDQSLVMFAPGDHSFDHQNSVQAVAV
jgi:hypothetical protein